MVCKHFFSSSFILFLGFAFEAHFSHPYKTAGTTIPSNISILASTDRSVFFSNSPQKNLKTFAPSPTLQFTSAFMDPKYQNLATCCCVSPLKNISTPIPTSLIILLFATFTFGFPLSHPPKFCNQILMLSPICNKTTSSANNY